MSASAIEDFWQWSLKHYACNGVEPLLLRLQDDFDFNINIALWCCWCADHFEAAPDLSLRNAIDRTDKWNAQVTQPLRSARRYLKSDETTAGAATLRGQIKDAELAAEKEEQMRLEALAESALSPLSEKSAPAPRARRNIAAYAALTGAAQKKNFTVSLLEELIDRIYASSPHEPANGDER